MMTTAIQAPSNSNTSDTSDTSDTNRAPSLMNTVDTVSCAKSVRTTSTSTLGIDALRVVLESTELEELEELSAIRMENARLKRALALWMGNTTIPEKGSYYFLDNHLVTCNGFSFGTSGEENEIVPFLYTGPRATTVWKRGKRINSLHFVFKAAYTMQDGSWCEAFVETHELHRVTFAIWDMFWPFPMVYIDMEDKVWISIRGEVSRCLTPPACEYFTIN